MPAFDPEKAAPTPEDQFVAWLDEALAAGVSAPHIVTLSTVEENGWPAARTLILKDVSAAGWQFAGQKGVLDNAALTFYWAGQGRQVRVRGPVTAAPTGESAADFLARSPAARAESFAGRQSMPLASADDLDTAVRAARARIDAEPDLVAAAWILYTVHAEQVEFFQAAHDRKHIRLQYLRAGTGWHRRLLWP